MVTHRNRKKIGAVAVVVLGIFVYFMFGSFDGGPVEVTSEAVPIWANSDLALMNKIVEYIFPFLLPIGGMVDCAVTPPYDVECMERGRDATAATATGAWKDLIDSSHDETVIKFSRDDTSTPLEVVLLQPKARTVPLVNSPLILWVHSGGFTTGVAQEMYLTFYLNKMRDDAVVSATVKNAVWASVEYRLAPEHSYPAAPDDCFLALKHLLEYRIDGIPLGGGGVHIFGISAGGTIAATVALRALGAGLQVDSLVVDEPLMILPERYGSDSSLSPLDSHSFRRNAYTRIVPVRWINWSLAAYVGIPLTELPNVTDLELTGGVMSSLEWEKVGSMPPLILLTAKGDILRDGGLAFGRVYKEAGGTVHSFETSSSHALAFLFDEEVAVDVVRKWSSVIEASAAQNPAAQEDD